MHVPRITRETCIPFTGMTQMIYYSLSKIIATSFISISIMLFCVTIFKQNVISFKRFQNRCDIIKQQMTSHFWVALFCTLSLTLWRHFRRFVQPSFHTPIKQAFTTHRHVFGVNAFEQPNIITSTTQWIRRMSQRTLASYSWTFLSIIVELMSLLPNASSHYCVVKSDTEQ